MTNEQRRALELERIRRICASTSELAGHALELLEHAISAESVDDAVSYVAAAGPMLSGAIEMIKVAV